MFTKIENFYSFFLIILLVNLKYAISGLPQGPYTVKNLNPVVGILNKEL